MESHCHTQQRIERPNIYIYISEQYEGRSQRARFDAPDWKLHHCGTM
jgi:hypothetical protein